MIVEIDTQLLNDIEYIFSNVVGEAFSFENNKDINLNYALKILVDNTKENIRNNYSNETEKIMALILKN